MSSRSWRSASPFGRKLRTSNISSAWLAYRFLANVADACHPWIPDRRDQNWRVFLGNVPSIDVSFSIYSHITRTLILTICKDNAVDWTSPTEDEVETFRELKGLLAAPPILGLPNIGRPYTEDGDGCVHTLGTVLIQQRDDEVAKEWASVGILAYLFRKELFNYCATNREL